MKQKKTQRRRRERGSALLLTLLLTLVGAALLGLSVDAVSLLWVRSHAQTTANLAAASVELEQKRNPTASSVFLAGTARASAAWNGYRHGQDSVAVYLDQSGGRASILVEREADIFFLRLFRTQPVVVRARAAIAAEPAARAGV
ncbi:MAG TPA: hypothetical protein VFQ91_24945 [Bryobacteraceae bacterium]|nr:hypothetical protein [Bryobacteraceae bacterium]